MRRLMIVVALLAIFAIPNAAQKEHPDYVPDQKTAKRIAEAILAARYGEDLVKNQLPFLVDGSNKTRWIVQGQAHDKETIEKGGGFAIWINKHSGCIELVSDHMK